MDKEDCIYFGEVQMKPNIFVEGCTLNYIRWCKYGCENCKKYAVEKEDGK